MDEFLKFTQIVKVDEAAHMVYGIVTSETPDADDEICDFATAKVEIKKWSDDQLAKTIAAGQEPSLGNFRVMHQLQVGGKAVKIECKEEAKQIWVGSEPANEEVWHLIKGGFLTGHSIGGKYLWKRKEGEYTRFGPSFNEISYVDKGSNPEATFAYVKADGTTELRKFAKPGPAEQEVIARLAKSTVANLSDVDVQRIAKALADSVLGTHAEELDAALAERMRQKNAAKGEDMTQEQIQKCAAALGITEAEFQKKYIDGDGFEKAAKGLAALHGHIEKAMDMHKEIMAHHDKMGKAHGAMETHLGKCSKACKDIMGSDEKASEKALKALIADLVEGPANFVSIGKTSDGVEIFKAKGAGEVKLESLAAPKEGEMKTEDVTKAIADAVAKATETIKKEFEEKLEKTLAPNNGGTGVRLSLIGRDGKELTKAEQADARNPMAAD